MKQLMMPELLRRSRVLRTSHQSKEENLRSGCQSSVAEVWRTSKFSPGAEAEFILRTIGVESLEVGDCAARMNDLVSIEVLEV